MEESLLLEEVNSDIVENYEEVQDWEEVQIEEIPEETSIDNYEEYLEYPDEPEVEQYIENYSNDLVGDFEEVVTEDYDSRISEVGDTDSPVRSGDNQSETVADSNAESTNLYYEQVLSYLENTPTDSDINNLSNLISENSTLITRFNNNMTQAEKNVRNLSLISITISLVTLGALVGTVVFSKFNP